MWQWLGDLAALLCGLYFLSLGLSHVRPRAFAAVGDLALGGAGAQFAGGGAIFLGTMIFLDDFLSGRVGASLLLGIAFAAVGVLWIRARRVDLLAQQPVPAPLAGYAYLAFGLVAAFFGLWSLLPG